MWNIYLPCLILATLISSIILIIKSNKNDNSIGANVGYIIMSFLIVFPIGLYLVGTYFPEYFNIVYIFVFGIFILFIAIILIVGLSTNLTENLENAQGICQKDGKIGYVINGECDISNAVNCDAAVQQSIKETCPPGSSSSSSGSSSSSSGSSNAVKSITPQAATQAIAQESFATQPIGSPLMGICTYIENGKTKFGFRHPDWGAACISKEKMIEAIKRNPKQVLTGIPGISYSSNPYQSTQCLKYPKTDYFNYDIECKKKFGLNYGVKLIENQGCAQNDYQAVCEQGYQMGEIIPNDSTKCVPIGKDMNIQCQLNHVDNPNKFGKYLRIGYKKINFTGCPKGSQRAICDGNYYDGKELFEKTTEPFPQTENPNRKCQAKYGLLSFSKNIISDNCAVGYVRAQCN
jgi:hypothetical protein